MAGVQEGLEVAFYLYPCGLFVALLASESVSYYRERRRASLGSSPVPNNEKDAEKISRLYNRLIWVAQLLLCALLASHQDSIDAKDPHANLFPYSSPTLSSWCAMQSVVTMTMVVSLSLSARIW